MTQKSIEKMNLLAMGYVTHSLYLVILTLLVVLVDSRYSPYAILSVWLFPGLLSIIIATRIIRHHYANNRLFSQTILKMALAQVPSLIGLVTAFVMLNQA